MNILDLIVIAIIISFVIYFFFRGFAAAVLNFFAFIIAFILANIFYSPIARFMRNTGGFFERLQNWVAETLGLNQLATQADHSLHSLLANLNLPQFVQNHITSGYTYETRALLNATSTADFVSAFIASAIINILAMLIAFMVAFVLIKILIHMIDIVTRLPVIRQVNKLFGAAMGAVVGLFASWLILTVLVWIFGSNPAFDVNQLLQNSLLAGPLQEINIISRVIANI